MDARHPATGATLDGVGAGFVERLTGGDIVVDLLIGERDKADKCNFGGTLPLPPPGETEAGDDLVGLPREEAEHAGGVGCVLRFAEDLFVDDNYRVRAENEGVRRDGVSSGDGLGLFTGETVTKQSGLRWACGVRENRWE